MTFLSQCGFALLLSLSLPNGDQPKDEVLPPPRLAPRIAVTPLYPVHPFFHADPYWRMRLYAPNRFGELRPRVIHGPQGAYWPLTGEPYFFTSVRGIQ
jgi:hypothetical protein